MATPDQKVAAKRVHDAVAVLNGALGLAGEEGLHVRLDTVCTIGRRNPTYVVAEIEIREAVRP